MNLSVQETYLGWHRLAHAPDCARPSWTIDLRVDDGHRSSYGSARANHTCLDEDCDHGSAFPQVTVRVVCACCHLAHVIRGEGHSQHHTTTRTTGVGEAPHTVSSLHLWPGVSWFDDKPHQWLATRSAPATIQPADVIGEIHEERGPRGGARYVALALPDAEGPYGLDRLRWRLARDGFRSLTAAAKWLAARLPEDSQS